MFLRLIVTDLKRILHLMIPLLLTTLTLLAVFLSLAFASDKLLYRNSSMKQVNVGLVISPDSSYTKMALSMVENMESYKSTCNFISIESREDGISKLSSNSIQALVVVPDNILSSIMTGENYPIEVFYTEDGSLETYTIDAVFKATSSMLATAQGGIGTAIVIAKMLNLDEGTIDKIIDDSNQLYLEYVLSRVDRFVTKECLVTGGYSSTQYFLASGILILLALSGMVFITFIKGNSPSYYMMMKMSKIGHIQLFSSRYLAVAAGLFGIYIPLYIIIAAAGLFLREPLVAFSISGIIYAVPAILAAAVLIVLIGSIPATYAGCCIILFLVTLLLAYTGGGILPPPLLPEFLKVSSYNTMYYKLLSLLCKGLFAG